MSLRGVGETRWLNRFLLNIRLKPLNAILTSILETPKQSMHWAVQSKKDHMLEAPDFGDTNEMWAQQMESSGEGLLEGSREQDVAIPDVKPQSSKNPDSPKGNYWHLRFRWSGDAPSDLLRKFRNYEI